MTDPYFEILAEDYMKKPKKQRVVITLTDDKDGKTFHASMTFEPKVSDVKLIESFTPCVNAAFRLQALLRGAGQDLGKPLTQRLEGSGPEDESRIIRP